MEPLPRVAIKVFDTDMMKNVWMSPHNRLKDSLIIDPKFLAFLAFIDSRSTSAQSSGQISRDAVNASVNLSSGETP